MPGTLIAVIVGVLFFWGAISFAVYKNIIEMSKTDHLPTVENEKIMQTDLHQWATGRGYAYLDTYLMEISGVRTYIAVWQHSHDPTFFAAYIVQSLNNKTAKPSKTVKQEMSFDLTTYFSGEHTLTTGSTSSGNLFPTQEGVYRQTLDYTDLDDLQQKHDQSAAYLTNFGGIQLGTLTQSVDDYMAEALRKTTAHIRSLFLWPLRGVWWYFVRRPLWHNLTIQAQHEKRKIKLPNEL